MLAECEDKIAMEAWAEPWQRCMHKEECSLENVARDWEIWLQEAECAIGSVAQLHRHGVQLSLWLVMFRPRFTCPWRAYWPVGIKCSSVAGAGLRGVHLKHLQVLFQDLFFTLQ